MGAGLIVDADLSWCRILLNSCLALIGMGVGAELNFVELVQGWRQASDAFEFEGLPYGFEGKRDVKR